MYQFSCSLYRRTFHQNDDPKVKSSISNVQERLDESVPWKMESYQVKRGPGTIVSTVQSLLLIPKIEYRSTVLEWCIIGLLELLFVPFTYST
jgi:hypothetical protein